MRRSVQIAGQVENLFGTLDENLKLFESALHVTTFFHDNRLTVEGESANVDRAVHILDQYNDLVREGRRMDRSTTSRASSCASGNGTTPASQIRGPTRLYSSVALDFRSFEEYVSPVLIT